jgi:RNA recognition motif-containing protein
MTTIYVGNLPFSATEQDIKVLFERHGKVPSKTSRCSSSAMARSIP